MFRLGGLNWGRAVEGGLPLGQGGEFAFIIIGDAVGAQLVVLTMDHSASAMHAVRGIRREFPGVPLFARARDERNARALAAAGATVVVPATLEASLQLSRFVLEAVGLDERNVDAIIDAERNLFDASLAQATQRQPL